jgi:hypothetical protein
MRRSALGVLAVVLLASSCSLGPREQWADAIHDGFDNAVEQGSAKVRMAAAVKAIETNIRQTQVPLIAKASGVVDFAKADAKLTEIAKRKATVYFDDLVAYLPRSEATRADDGGKQRWASLDFEREPREDIDDNDRRVAIGAGVLISPVLAVEMLKGVLTGSIEETGRETKGGVETTRYTAKLAPDQAVRDVDDDDRREGVIRVFQSIGVRQDIFPISVWIDDEGLVRGLRFTQRQQKDRVNAFMLVTSWEFFDYGAPAKIALPSPGDTFEARRTIEFIVQFVREGAQF